ncbi:MAG: polyprenyl synthetase family protein [Saprospiraceae bacterium]
MQTLRQILEEIKSYSERQDMLREPQNLYAPIEYILELGGKRLRPALVLMSNNLYADNIESALPAAFAIELFHNFTLMHDDIMDKAPLRRGKQTVHEKYDINTGILSGDAMLILSYQYLLKNCENDNIAAKIIKIFNKSAIEVCEGQQMDMDFENRQDVSISEYLKMIELKTAVLLGAALEIGTVMATDKQDDARHLYEFGRNIGIAFQLQDDILDSFGDPLTFGKKVGGDISQNKKTFLYLHSLELASAEMREDLWKWYHSEEETDRTGEKIEEVKRIFLQCGVVEKAHELKNRYYQEAMKHLEEVSVEDHRKSVLRNFAEDLLHRNV